MSPQISLGGMEAAGWRKWLLPAPPDSTALQQTKSDDASVRTWSVDIYIHAHHRHIYTQGKMHASNTLIN